MRPTLIRPQIKQMLANFGRKLPGKLQRQPAASGNAANFPGGKLRIAADFTHRREESPGYLPAFANGFAALDPHNKDGRPPGSAPKEHEHYQRQNNNRPGVHSSPLRKVGSLQRMLYWVNSPQGYGMGNFARQP